MKLLSRKEDGQALVEFALVLPLLLLILCGIIDFGWMFYSQLSVQNACREGARYACVHSADGEAAVQSSVKTMVQTSIPKNLDNANLYVDVDYINDADPTSGDVKVTVRAELEFLTPVLGTLYHNNKRTLSDTVTMKVES